MPNHLEIEKNTTASVVLCEGSSNRDVERMTEVHRDIMMRPVERVDKGIKVVQDELFSDLKSDHLVLDEIEDSLALGSELQFSQVSLDDLVHDCDGSWQR